MDDANFYSGLQAFTLPLTELFREENFRAVPSSWHVVIADVKNSTQAVAADRHNDVNLAAAGSLVAALNVAKEQKTEVPFFFGGDGSTLLVPGELLNGVLLALTAHSLNTADNFGLQLHIGSLPVKEVLSAGHQIKIAKLYVDASLVKAVVIGDGLHYAEQKIKQGMGDEKESLSSLAALNLNGLECRWNKIQPPVAEAGNVCYLMEAVKPGEQFAVYTDVLKQIEAVYGNEAKRNPLSIEQLTRSIGFKKLRREMLAKFGKWKPAYLAGTFLRTLFGRLYFKYNWKIGGLRGKEYLAQLIAHADTLTVDGRINTIICGREDQHQRFLRYLSQQEAQGLLVYGHHNSKESIMTCYIEARNAKHIHFVDGADGGYTEAAKEFKAKLKNVLPV